MFYAKVGDRVRITDPGSRDFDKVGTVMVSKPMTAIVELDEPVPNELLGEEGKLQINVYHKFLEEV